MYTAYDKAIAIAVMSVVSLGVLFFHWSLPGWLTETNLEQILAVLAPIVVGLVPNKTTTAQKTEVLATVGVTPAMASMGVGTGGMPVDAPPDTVTGGIVGGLANTGPNPVSHLQ